MYELTSSEMCCVLKRLTESQSEYPRDTAREKWENDKVEESIQKLSKVYHEMCVQESNDS